MAHMQRKISLYEPLVALADANLDARLELWDILAQNRVNVTTDRTSMGEDSLRGLAFFFAFDPWMTSLRCPPGSAGFFSAAKRNKLITEPEAVCLENALIEIGAQTAATYKGPFESFFKDRKVAQNLNARARRAMEQAGLPVPENWVDSLFEDCLFPLHPERHMSIQYFEPLKTAEEVEFYSKSSWLAWTEALDLVCLGPWAGLNPKSILDMVEAVGKAKGNVTAATIQNSFIGHKVTLPVTPRGLQGVVFGFFRDAPLEREKIFQSLLQFGGALGDVYADLRWTAFVEALKSGNQSEADIAREVVNVVSPISKVIVQRGGHSAGYKILEQDGGYWGGYQELTKSELVDTPSEMRFEVKGPEGLKIFIEPLAGLFSINPEFARIRLQHNLIRALAQATQPEKGEILTREDVEELFSRSQESKASALSVPKLRKHYVISAVRERWSEGSAKVTNGALKAFLESELGHEPPSGFQITSFISETEDIFSRKVKVSKESSNSIALSWNPGMQSA
jgi:hypothetical protein